MYWIEVNGAINVFISIRGRIYSVYYPLTDVACIRNRVGAGAFRD
jgi:GH15 family glucan-1,4-alpha-glucosidase